MGCFASSSYEVHRLVGGNSAGLPASLSYFQPVRVVSTTAPAFWTAQHLRLVGRCQDAPASAPLSVPAWWFRVAASLATALHLGERLAGAHALTQPHERPRKGCNRLRCTGLSDRLQTRFTRTYHDSPPPLPRMDMYSSALRIHFQGCRSR
jgi:hypothetical protein